MALNARVAVSGEDEKCAFTLNAKATSLNKHGAAIQLNRQLSLGSTVMVRNGQGAQAQVRVVGKVSVVGEPIPMESSSFKRTQGKASGE